MEQSLELISLNQAPRHMKEMQRLRLLLLICLVAPWPRLCISVKYPHSMADASSRTRVSVAIIKPQGAYLPLSSTSIWHIALSRRLDIERRIVESCFEIGKARPMMF